MSGWAAGVEVFGSVGRTLDLDQPLEVEDAHVPAEYPDRDRVREEVFVGPAADDLAEEVDVAQVLSPSDRSSGMQEKTLDYLQAGARLVWIVDPRARTVTVIRPDGSARIMRERDTLDGEDVLVGFSVEVAELFRER